jgi:hypothetical protein
MASPKASAASFSFMASSITFLALLSLLYFVFDLFFFFLLLLIGVDTFVAVVDSPPRSFWINNGIDNDGDVEIDFAGAVVMAVTVSNFAHDKQTISSNNTVLHEEGDMLSYCMLKLIDKFENSLDITGPDKWKKVKRDNASNTSLCSLSQPS